jgi:prepilin-type N-terminal cleavage/methylation domain-containing protein
VKNLRGQSIIEVLVTVSIISIIATASVVGYRNFEKTNQRIRDRLQAATLYLSFAQLAAEASLIREMFVDDASNASFETCLRRGSCSNSWVELNYNQEKEWIYSQAGIRFEYRGLPEELIELRIHSSTRPPVMLSLSRYDFLNWDSNLKKIQCGFGYVIAGIDFSWKRAICRLAAPRPKGAR